jgi:hypothetical protein
MMPIRAKFRVTSISQDMNGAKVNLVQIVGGVVKDKVFLSFLSGDIKLVIPPFSQEIGLFKPGMDFYVDFVESEDA